MVVRVVDARVVARLPRRHEVPGAAVVLVLEARAEGVGHRLPAATTPLVREHREQEAQAGGERHADEGLVYAEPLGSVVEESRSGGVEASNNAES